MVMLKPRDLVAQPQLIHHRLVNQEQIVLLLIPPPRQEVAQPGNIITKQFILFVCEIRDNNSTFIVSQYKPALLRSEARNLYSPLNKNDL